MLYMVRATRVYRQLDYISQFMAHIRYMKGNHNTVAGTLSRAIINASSKQSPHFNTLADEQQSCYTLSDLKEDISL